MVLGSTKCSGDVQYDVCMVLYSQSRDLLHLFTRNVFMYFLYRDCLAFCTEPVCASLANVLGNWDNLPSPLPSDIKEYKLYDVETKYGLLQV